MYTEIKFFENLKLKPKASYQIYFKNRKYTTLFIVYKRISLITLQL